MQQPRKGSLPGAMKIHRELHNSDVGTAQEAVLEIKEGFSRYPEIGQGVDAAANLPSANVPIYACPYSG